MLAFGALGGIVIAVGTQGLMAANTPEQRVSLVSKSSRAAPADKTRDTMAQFREPESASPASAHGFTILPVETVPDLLPLSRQTVSSRIILTNSSLEAVPAQMVAPIPLTPTAKAKLKPKPRKVMKMRQVQPPEPQQTWWQRLPWIRID
jgi:hypothetical protein